MKKLYAIYQYIIVIPIVVVAFAVAGTIMSVMCPVTGWLKRTLPFPVGVMTRPDWWGSKASRWWGRIIIRSCILPVEVKGRENIEPGTSYVFVANHQGAFDILLVCGFLGAEIRWMMKRALEKVPFLGAGCRHAGYIFVDKGNAGAVRATYRRAEEALRGGASLMVFPEGSRSYTGRLGEFRRGAFTLADELQLPVLPMTINGSFDVLPRTKGLPIARHRLSLTIHKPILPLSQGQENIERLRDESFKAIQSALVI